MVCVKEKKQAFQEPATVWTSAAHQFSPQAEGDGWGPESSVLQDWPFWGVVGRYNYGVSQADSDSKISGKKKKKPNCPQVTGVAMSQPD